MFPASGSRPNEPSLDDVSARWQHCSWRRFEISDGFWLLHCYAAQVGANGTGKTTLLKILLGELSPVSGVHHVHRSLRMGYFSQHHVDQLDMNVSSVQVLEAKFPGLFSFLVCLAGHFCLTITYSVLIVQLVNPVA